MSDITAYIGMSTCLFTGIGLLVVTIRETRIKGLTRTARDRILILYDVYSGSAVKELLFSGSIDPDTAIEEYGTALAIAKETTCRMLDHVKTYKVMLPLVLKIGRITMNDIITNKSTLEAIEDIRPYDKEHYARRHNFYIGALSALTDRLDDSITKLKIENG